MKTKIKDIIEKAKQVDAITFDKWLTDSKVNYEWLDVTLSDFNDGYYNIELQDGTNILFINGEFAEN